MEAVGVRAGGLADREFPDAGRLPLVVRGVDDVRRLRVLSRQVPRLPESGLRVLVEGLDPGLARRLEERSRAYIGACGCAEGAAAGLLTFVASCAWLAREISRRGWRPGDALAAVGIVLLAAAAMGAAKFAAIRLARRRFERCCEAAIAALEAS